jgi:hypothetical protein
VARLELRIPGLTKAPSTGGWQQWMVGGVWDRAGSAGSCASYQKQYRARLIGLWLAGLWLSAPHCMPNVALSQPMPRSASQRLHPPSQTVIEASSATPPCAGSAVPPTPANTLGFVALFGYDQQGQARTMDITRNEGITGVTGAWEELWGGRRRGRVAGRKGREEARWIGWPEC